MPEPKKKVGQGQVRIQNVFFDIRSDTMIVLLKGREIIVKNISDFPFLENAGIEALQDFRISYKGIYWDYFAQLLKMRDLIDVEEEASESLEEGEVRKERKRINSGGEKPSERFNRKKGDNRSYNQGRDNRKKWDDHSDNRGGEERRRWDDRSDNRGGEERRRWEDRSDNRGGEERRRWEDRSDNRGEDRSNNRNRGDDRPRKKPESNDPGHGVRLVDMLEHLVEVKGWEEMGTKVRVRCFKENPSIQSSLKFLRKTDWAREKVERMYFKSLSKK